MTAYGFEVQERTSENRYKNWSSNYIRHTSSEPHHGEPLHVQFGWRKRLGEMRFAQVIFLSQEVGDPEYWGDCCAKSLVRHRATGRTESGYHMARRGNLKRRYASKEYVLSVQTRRWGCRVREIPTLARRPIDGCAFFPRPNPRLPCR